MAFKCSELINEVSTVGHSIINGVILSAGLDLSVDAVAAVKVADAGVAFVY
jgi:hypothetical protein